jgi:hypothetical protein
MTFVFTCLRPALSQLAVQVHTKAHCRVYYMILKGDTDGSYGELDMYNNNG